MTMIKRLRFLPFLFLFLAPVQAETSTSPMDVVRATSEQVFEELRQHDELSDAQINRLIDKVIMPHVDFEAFSRLILARHWRRASPEQREAFIREFRRMLTRTYASSLNQYSGESIEYLMERNDGDGQALVRTQVVRPNGPAIPVDYRLRRKGDKWLVYDVTIEGVSLIINYRSSFQQIIRQRGLDGLIRQLVERDGLGQSAKAATES